MKRQKYGIIWRYCMGLVLCVFLGWGNQLSATAEHIGVDNSEKVYPIVVEEGPDYNLVELSAGQVVAILHNEAGIGENTAGIRIENQVGRDVGHTGRLGSVSANGWTTIVNDIFVNNHTGFCAERSADPVSYAAHFNNGVLDQSKMTWSIAVGLENLYGDTSGHSLAVRKVATQAAIWYFEGAFPANGSVYADDGGDVSAVFRAIITRVDSVTSGDNIVKFDKDHVTTSYDAETNTIISAPFKIIEASTDLTYTLNVPEGYSVTKVGSTQVLHELKRNEEVVVRTANLQASEQVIVEVQGSVFTVKGKRFGHDTYPNLQEMVQLEEKEEQQIKASISVTFTPAFGSYQLEKQIQYTGEHPVKLNKWETALEAELGVLVKGPDGYEEMLQFTAEEIDGEVVFRSVVQHVLPGRYTYQESSTSWQFVLDPQVYTFDVEPNKHVAYELTHFTNEVSLGSIQIIKAIDQNIHAGGDEVNYESLYPLVAIRIKSLETYATYDETYHLTVDGTLFVDGLPFGKYQILEVTAPPELSIATEEFIVHVGGLNRDVIKDVTDVKSILPIVQTITNKVKRGGVKIEKHVVDDAYEGYPRELWKMDEIVVSIESVFGTASYKREFHLDKQGRLEVGDLPFGIYEIREIAVPIHMELDATVHQFSLITDGQVGKFSYTNRMPATKIGITKKNTNGDFVSGVTFQIATDLLRDSTGQPVPFKMVNGKSEKQPMETYPTATNNVYYTLDPKTVLLENYQTIAPFGYIESKAIPSGFQQVYIQEIAVPEHGGLVINRQPKLITLIPDAIVAITFVNNIASPGIIEIHKQLEDNTPVAAVFELFKIVGENWEYMETIQTDAITGIGRSSIIQLIDEENNRIQYALREQRSASYLPIDPIAIILEDWDATSLTYRLNVVNNLRKITAKLWKSVEENTKGITAAGAEFTWFNSANDVLGVFNFTGNGAAELTTPVAVQNLLDGKGTYLVETKFPIGVRHHQEHMQLTSIDIRALQHGDTLELNTQVTSIINYLEVEQLIITGESTQMLLMYSCVSMTLGYFIYRKIKNKRTYM